MCFRKRFCLLLTAFTVVALSVVQASIIDTETRFEDESLFETAPWTFSFGLGHMTFEGDEEVENGLFLALKMGYSLNSRFTLEGIFNIAPSLENREFDDERFALEDDIWAARIGAEMLLHLRNTENLRFDPFLAAGAGFFFWEESLGAGAEEFIVTAGGGLFYHLNDEWALRGDLRTEIVGADTEAKLLTTIGATWRWGAHVPRDYAVTGAGEVDSDGDGLLDSEEIELGTDPYNPDTDGDGLTDGQEVREFKTDPLDPDTDLDALTDGAEVLTYGTNPLNRDTDNGGVADGHEVIEDHTDPLDPADDLQLFTLNIEFDYNKADIRPQYYDDLDIIVRVLQRDPGSTARIEGHADKRKKSDKKYNQHLSEKRAKSVMAYLIDVGGISPARLEAVGYGFERPIVPNDSEENMQKNRRVEVYIRDGDQQGNTEEAAAPAEGAFDPTLK